MILTCKKGIVPTKYLTIEEPIRESDVQIVTNPVEFSTQKKKFSTRVYVQLKQDIAELNGVMSYTYVKELTLPVRFNGLRTSEARKKKYDELEKQFHEMIQETKDTIMEPGLEEMNKRLVNLVNHENKRYVDQYVQFLRGDNLSEDWLKENIDAPNIYEQIENIDREIQSLRQKKEELYKIQRSIRNKGMLKWMEKQDWVITQDNEEIQLPSEVIQKVTDIYEKGEGFKLSHELFI